MMGTIFRRHFYSHRTWDNGFKLKQSTINIETKENFFFYEGTMFRFSKNIKNASAQIKVQTGSYAKVSGIYGFYLILNMAERGKRKKKKRKRGGGEGQKDSDRDRLKKISPL